VKAIVYMECIVRPFRSWDEWPENTKAFFQRKRTPEGEEMILEKNLFIEYLLLFHAAPSGALDTTALSIIPAPMPARNR
jgi:haloalkane dehalogenase